MSTELCADCVRLLESMQQLAPVGNVYTSVPEGLRGGLLRYIVHGIRPGDFLTAVLSNDLAEACARADDLNRHRLFDICFWLYNHAPSPCWKSPKNVAAWLEAPRSTAACGLLR